MKPSTVQCAFTYLLLFTNLAIPAHSESASSQFKWQDGELAELLVMAQKWEIPQPPEHYQLCDLKKTCRDISFLSETAIIPGFADPKERKNYLLVFTQGQDDCAKPDIQPATLYQQNLSYCLDQLPVTAVQLFRRNQHQAAIKLFDVVMAQRITDQRGRLITGVRPHHLLGKACLDAIQYNQPIDLNQASRRYDKIMPHMPPYETGFIHPYQWQAYERLKATAAYRTKEGSMNEWIEQRLGERIIFDNCFPIFQNPDKWSTYQQTWAIDRQRLIPELLEKIDEKHYSNFVTRHLNGYESRMTAGEACITLLVLFSSYRCLDSLPESSSELQKKQHLKKWWKKALAVNDSTFYKSHAPLLLPPKSKASALGKLMTWIYFALTILACLVVMLLFPRIKNHDFFNKA